MLNTDFLLTSLIVVLIPGTGVIYTVSNGLFLGWRAGIAAALGCTAGILPHLTACILGLSALLHMSAVVFQTVKCVGAAYLLYLAWTMWRQTGEIKLNSHSSRRGLAQIAIQGFLINILNPKLSIFFLAFLPLFISPYSVSPTMDLLLLSMVFMAITFVIFVIYGLTADSVRKYVIGSPKAVIWMQRSFAATFTVLGLKLAFTKR